MSNSISSSLSSTASGSSPQPSRFNELTSEDFVKIMFTELSNQDPLKPNDSNQLLNQMSSLRSIESDLALTKKLDAVVSQNQLATAGALLGQTVTGLTEQFDQVTGVVKSITQSSSGPVLTLKSGARIPFDFIQTMEQTPAPTPPPTPNPNPNPTPTAGSTRINTGLNGSMLGGPPRPIKDTPTPTLTSTPPTTTPGGTLVTPTTPALTSGPGRVSDEP